MKSNSLAVITQLTDEISISPEFSYLINDFTAVLPESIEFDEDKWNVIDWLRKKGNVRNFNIDYSPLINDEYKAIAKLYICYKRFSQFIEGNTAKTIAHAPMRTLGEVLGHKPFKRINSSDFYEAEKKLIKNYDRNAAYRYAGHLQAFSYWLNSKYSFSIKYNTKIASNYKHGRKATDEERDKKLIPSECFLDIIRHADDNSLAIRDKFFINVFVLCVSGGFRIGEVMTLPANQPFLTSSSPKILYYPEKGGELGVKPIAPSFLPAVQSSINKITEWTMEGRKIAKDITSGDNLDWYAIYQDSYALRYYFEKFCHTFTSDPLNRILNPDGAWFQKKKRYIDVISLLKEHGSFIKASEAVGIPRNTLSIMKKEQEDASMGILPSPRNKSRGKTRDDWSNDLRYISFTAFEKNTDKIIKFDLREPLQDILKDAQELQLKGAIYPAPEFNEKIENQYSRKKHPIIVKYKNNDTDREIVLEAADCLLVTPKYLLSSSRDTKTNSYSIIDEKRFSEWLSGTSRGRGQGGDEESIFTRLNIIDPRTNKPLSATIHDVRHWLNTLMNEGGASQESIRLMFARKSIQTNAVYDQTSAKTRCNRLKEGVRKGTTYGEIQDNYNVIFAEFGRDKAEEYLNSKAAMMTIMPHGGCTMSWVRGACERNMSCFGGDEICEDFCIDIEDKEQLNEVERIYKEQVAMKSILPSTSPQMEFVVRVSANIEKVLKKAGSKDE